MIVASNQYFVIETVTIEFGDTLENRPKKQSVVRVNYLVLPEHFEECFEIPVADLNYDQSLG